LTQNDEKGYWGVITDVEDGVKGSGDGASSIPGNKKIEIHGAVMVGWGLEPCSVGRFKMIEIEELLQVFGFFLLVLIGVELLETIKAYFVEHIVHVEVVVEVAMIAIARKVITLDVKDYEPLHLCGIAFIIIALSLAYFVVKRGHEPHS